MVEVLLVQPPVRDFYLTAKRTIPSGPAAIAATLLREGISVSIFDALASRRAKKILRPAEMAYLDALYPETPDLSPFGLFSGYRHYGYAFDTIGKAAAESGAALVGISSLFTAYADAALETAAAVRRHHPGAKIVMGGHHATWMHESLMDSPDVDYVLRGEGEVSMPALYRLLRAGVGRDLESLKSVPGIVFRKPGGDLYVRPPAFMDDLDRFPPPAGRLIRNDYYRRRGRGCMVVTASRGCPMACSYCSVGASAGGVPYRRRSVESVLNEIETGVTEHDVRFIDFEDENLSLDAEWFSRLLWGIQTRFSGLGLELRAMNGLYPPSLTGGIIGEMKRAGFFALNLSLGSTSAVRQRRFHRPPMNAAFDAAVRAARRCGIHAVGYIIVAAPGQSPGESVDDLLYLSARDVLAAVSVFYPAPGSLDYERCRRRGLLPESRRLYRSTAFPVVGPAGRVEAATLLRLSRILNFMKSLRDDGEGIPPPAAEPIAPGSRLRPGDRRQAGKTLLSAFLADGVIRGISPQGEIFCHKSSPELIRRFLRGLENIKAGEKKPAAEA
jgi:radical SAM superfamily enzyme YgiQ (UPF0313 family)